MCLSFCPQGGVVSQHALQVSRPTPRGRLRGLVGGSAGPHPEGKLRGLGGLQAHTQGGGKLRGLGGGLQAHTQGGSWGVWPGGSPGPHPGGGWGVWLGGGGVSMPTPNGCIPASTEADTPLPQQMANAVGGTHHTGMHSCFLKNFERFKLVINDWELS